MKLSEKVAIVVLTASFLGSCAADRKYPSSSGNIYPVSGGKEFDEGSLVYALPMTVVDIRIETERTVEKPGPYARFADDMLGLKDVIRSDAEHWQIKGITISTHEELDPSGFYVIEASSLFTTNVLAMKKEGLILDLNPEL